MITLIKENYCKECFRSIVDNTASDLFLYMSPDNVKCTSCGKVGSVVGHYFKFGEHTVTKDGKHIVGEARHVGVNPDYSPWGFCYPYADVENYTGKHKPAVCEDTTNVCSGIEE